MLTIEKRPSIILPKASVLVAAFMIGLIGSAGVLYTIDPKNNATVVQSAETNEKEERTEQTVKPAASRPTTEEKSAEAKTPAWVQPTHQEGAQGQPASSESTSERKPKSEPEASADDSPAGNEDTSRDDSGGFDVPILRPLSP